MLDKLIKRDQPSLIKEKIIGENIILICAIIQYTDHKQVPGLLMLRDFKNSFDIISSGLLTKH